jgi:2-dehydro-3-deoxyphosphogluconate aldolase/(4S)-4-hydroxy-2-oxoglutarate aldolase
MDKQKVRDRIIEIGIVPVVRASSAGEARVAADAVCQGGIPIVEITMTVPGAVDVIRELAKNSASDVLIGAGTVLNPEAARRCLDAGAQFLVSPGLNLKTVELAVREGKLIMAGALTPTEVITAWDAGADFAKSSR